MRFIRLASSYLCLLFSMALWLIFLFRQRAVLRDADTVVCTNSPRAFGTLFITIDEARRLYRSGRTVYFSLSEGDNHNRLLALALRDIEFVDAPRSILRLNFLGRPVELPPRAWHDPMSCALTAWWLRRFGKPGARVLTPFDVWHEAPVPDEAAAVLPRTSEDGVPRPGPFKAWAREARAIRRGRFDIGNELHQYGAWNTLRQQMPADRMVLPDSVAGPIRSRLAAFAGGASTQRRICGFHLRYGGGVDHPQRDGSPLEFYLPALEELVNRGYQVLLQGDRVPHRQYRDHFQGWMVDAETAGVKQDVWRLFCGTEPDIFIGDWPVAPQLAAVNSIRTLVVNAWPVGWGLNDIWVDYRGIADADGTPWTLEEQLRLGPIINCNGQVHFLPELYGNDEQLYDRLANARQIRLGREDILKSVRYFLDAQADWPGPDPHADLLSLFPRWCPAAMATGLHLNPAWVDRNRG